MRDYIKIPATDIMSKATARKYDIQEAGYSLRAKASKAYDVYSDGVCVGTYNATSRRFHFYTPLHKVYLSVR